jgi:hypothetical protein
MLIGGGFLRPLVRTVLVFAVVATLAGLAALASLRAAPTEIQISTVSSRPDMVSGGDALLRVEAPAAINVRDVRVTLGDTDVTRVFRSGQGGHVLTGLVTGLADGNNTIAVKVGRRPAATLTLVNHPITGPVFAGPKEQPFLCQTEEFKLRAGGTLSAPLDTNCSIKTRFDFLYRSTEGGNLKPLPDPKSAPADLAQATIAGGAAVPYIVRVETGTINRGIYQIAMLYNPARDAGPDFTTGPAGWNGRLIYTFGGGCMTGWYRQGATTGGVEDDVMLRQGYAVASSTLNVLGNNCDDVLATETMMMVKEHFIEAYGLPKFTIGMGCSGGAEQVHPIAQNYPGLLDGIIPGCSFSDVASGIATPLVDARLLNHYFTTLAAMPYSDQQKLAIAGFFNLAHMVKGANEYAGRITVGEFCPAVLPQSQRYDAKTNPKGARCDIYDHAVNVYGRDPRTGFARRPLDNVGVQYGLTALNAGTISKAQFLDLNEKVGGYDSDGHVVPQRAVADPEALRIAYSTGRVTSGAGGLATTPVIDYRAYADDKPDGDPHLRFHSFMTRARLVKANGHADNQIMLIEDRSAAGGNLYGTKSAVLTQALAQMDSWLTRLADDRSSDPPIVKVRRAKPADLVDACWSRDPIARKIAETQEFGGAGKCEELYPSGTFPRGVAGSPIASDAIKCQLKNIDPADYKVTFTADETARLERMFPGGVCDWSKPGVGQQKLAGTWLRYGDGQSPADRTASRVQ